MRGNPVETALMIGGGSGMGRAAALRLARPGRTIWVADLDPAAAADTALAVIEAGGDARGFGVDVADPASVAALFAALRGQCQGLDLMVHTAAILGETAFIEDVSDAAWRRMIAVNLDGPFYCCREAVRWMRATGGGRILLFSSVAALTPTPGALPYSAAKGAVNMLGRTLAAEAAKHNIRVNVIAPGYVETPMLGGLPGGFAEFITRKTPLKRLGREDEMAALVEFMASPEADFFTGQVISPNGGLVI